jgi:arginase
MTEICILEFPSNLGLREPAPGVEPGVKKLPAWLRKHGFHDLVRPAKVYSIDPPPYSIRLDNESGVRNADAIARYARQQAVLLEKVLSLPSFPVVIGGDCSILIGNALALKKIGRYGLFFLDGHTDFMGPALSETGGAAGMDLAIVTGHGHGKLSNIGGVAPYIPEDQVWCVGNRDYDEAYVKTIKDSRIHYFDLASVMGDGIPDCTTGFFHMVETQKLDGFWVHLDVDVLSDELMPAVDSRQAGGLSYAALEMFLQALLSHPRAIGIEITILDPDLDPTGQHTTAFVHHFCTSFNGARGIGAPTIGIGLPDDPGSSVADDPGG